MSEMGEGISTQINRPAVLGIWETEALTQSTIIERLKTARKGSRDKPEFSEALEKLIFPPLKEISLDHNDINVIALNLAYHVLDSDIKKGEKALGGVVSQMLFTESFLRMDPSLLVKKIEDLSSLTRVMVDTIVEQNRIEITPEQLEKKFNETVNSMLRGAAGSAIARVITKEKLGEESPERNIIDQSPTLEWDILYQIDGVFKKDQGIIAVMQSKSHIKEDRGVPGRGNYDIKLQNRDESFAPEEYKLTSGRKFYFTLIRSKKLGEDTEELLEVIPYFDPKVEELQRLRMSYFNNPFLYFAKAVNMWRQVNNQSSPELFYAVTNFKDINFTSGAEGGERYGASSFVMDVATFVQNKLTSQK